MLSRELTIREKALIKRSVIKNCACYDREYGCLPLDSVCYMMTIGYTDSSLCRYYEKCILPIQTEIQNILDCDKKFLRNCKICGKKFFADRNRQYCSENCTLTARRKGTARRMRKCREAAKKKQAQR